MCLELYDLINIKPFKKKHANKQMDQKLNEANSCLTLLCLAINSAWQHKRYSGFDIAISQIRIEVKIYTKHTAKQ